MDAPSDGEAIRRSLEQKLQRMLDQSVPHTSARWAVACVIFVLYCIRVYLLQGFYIITYGLGIYLLHLLIGFLSPQEDFDGDGPMLPTSDADEFKPFQRRLPEFKVWYSFTKAVSISIVATLFPFLDIPVFWPILLVYFISLFFMTMKKQINHMITHKYVPFSFGKKRYTATKSNK